MKEKVTAKLDVHEQDAPQMLTALDGHKEVEEWKLSALDAGDLHLTFGDSDLTVIFERKKPSDYAGTLMGKEGTRLDEQIQKLSDFDGPAYILIEGNQEDFRSLTGTNIGHTSLNGSVASTDVRYLEGVRFCSDADGLVDMAIRLARKHKEDPSASSLQASVIEKDAAFYLRALGSLEGVGETRARDLGEAFNGMRDIQNATVSDIASVEGLGEKTATSVYTQLHDGEFWARVDRRDEDECWEWKGTDDGHGYGVMFIAGESVFAHRFSYMLEYGVIEDDFVLHHCDNKSCVNPEHLYSGDHADNMQDRAMRQPETFVSGEGNGNSQLTEDDVAVIKWLIVNTDYSQAEIAWEYDVAEETIRKIASEQSWKDVDSKEPSEQVSIEVPWS